MGRDVAVKKGTEEGSGLGLIDLPIFPKFLFGLQVLRIETNWSIDPVNAWVVLEQPRES